MVKGISSCRVSILVMRTSSVASSLVTMRVSPSWMLELSVRAAPLKFGFSAHSSTEGQVVLPGDGPQGVADLDRVGLLLLADAGDHILDGIVVLEAVVEIDAVFEQNGLAEADGDVSVVLVLFLVGASRLFR